MEVLKVSVTYSQRAAVNSSSGSSNICIIEANTRPDILKVPNNTDITTIAANGISRSNSAAPLPLAPELIALSLRPDATIIIVIKPTSVISTLQPDFDRYSLSGCIAVIAGYCTVITAATTTCNPTYTAASSTYIATGCTIQRIGFLRRQQILHMWYGIFLANNVGDICNNNQKGKGDQHKCLCICKRLMIGRTECCNSSSNLVDNC
uniref:Uncharacterized protein n=1 Tax=Glossina austeni TaxID=7395 RepID=A0A1A9VCG5_GLOAU